MEWDISDRDIESTEKLLLPEGSHFPDDARDVIRCWHSTDVAACPGSGKTTILLAKLKLLADRMPLENGAGICVLSHTNVAVNEIKKRLSGYADKLLGYPNYIGTIQSFFDKFVTMPYLRNIAGRNVQAVDNSTYALHMLLRIYKDDKYGTLKNMIRANYKPGGQFKNQLDYVQSLYLRNDGALCVKKQKKSLAGADRPSAKQYKALVAELRNDEGIIRYQDTYLYAIDILNDMPETYKNFFSSRFQYVFIDEYQDCDDVQRHAIDSIFNSTKCAVIKIGDSDQAIYNSSKDETTDWIPQDNYLPIRTSCRYSQEIANVICRLKKDNTSIVTYAGNTTVKPVLLVFNLEKIDRVIGGFISVLKSHGLYDNNGVYKAIGAVKNEDSSGLKIGSYWSGFDSSAKKQSEYSYWAIIDDITNNLINGKLYKAERNVRKLLCRIFHYAKIKNSVSHKEYSVITIKKKLDDEYWETYRQWIYELSRLQNVDINAVDIIMRQKINELLENKIPKEYNVFESMPTYFIENTATINQIKKDDRNVFIDSSRGRRIEFDTIHGVKGETHDATLYLETDRNGASDLSRLLPYFGVGKIGSSNLFDYSRKLAYVGMSRPRKLLCVAMQAKTYEKSKGVFDNDWEIIDLRK